MANILCIDDSLLVLRMLQNNLENAGHTVFVAEDWAEARQHLKTEIPIELVIVDVILPGFQSGAEMAKSLKIHPKIRFSKIIFYSSKSEKFLARQSQLLRLDGYISKEISGPELVKKIHFILNPSAESEDSEDDSEGVSLPEPPQKPLPKVSEEMKNRWKNES